MTTFSYGSRDCILAALFWQYHHKHLVLLGENIKESVNI